MDKDLKSEVEYQDLNDTFVNRFLYFPLVLPHENAAAIFLSAHKSDRALFFK